MMISVRVPKELKEKLEQDVEKYDLNTSIIVRRLLEQYLFKDKNDDWHKAILNDWRK